MSWFLVILFLSLSFSTSFSEATNHDDNKKILPSAFVVGKVYCDTCLQQTFSKESHFISGASVAVECKVKNSKSRFYTEVKTNEHGEFKVKLPFLLKKHVKRIKGCSLRLISSSEPYCAIASTSTTSLSLKKKLQGEYIFSGGDFSFKPMKKPHFCDQKHSSTIPNFKKHVFKEHVHVKHKHSIAKFKERVYVMKSSKKSHFSDQKDFSIFPPLIPNPFQPPPLIPNPLQPPPLIPNPLQPPSPPLIPNPFQPSPPPFLPNPFQPPSPPPFLPNPFQPPSPPPFLPNPFQPPSPPPFLPNPFQPPPSSPPPFIPNPFQPPPSSPPPSFPFPPIVIPGLTPSPPPPPPPKSVFPFPLPPLFPPPHSPGSPPTSSKHSSP